MTDWVQLAHLGHVQHGMLLQDVCDSSAQLARHKGRGTSESPVSTGDQLRWTHCHF